MSNEEDRLPVQLSFIPRQLSEHHWEAGLQLMDSATKKLMVGFHEPISPENDHSLAKTKLRWEFYLERHQDEKIYRVTYLYRITYLKSVNLSSGDKELYRVLLKRY